MMERQRCSSGTVVIASVGKDSAENTLFGRHPNRFASPDRLRTPVNRGRTLGRLSREGGSLCRLPLFRYFLIVLPPSRSRAMRLDLAAGGATSGLFHPANDPQCL